MVTLVTAIVGTNDPRGEFLGWASLWPFGLFGSVSSIGGSYCGLGFWLPQGLHLCG